MVSTPLADADPLGAGPTDAPVPDILDTTAAGPSVIRGGLLRLGGLLLGTLAMVLSSAVMIRHLGVVDTGHFITITALVAIVGGMSDLGLSAIAVREYSVVSQSEGQHVLRNLFGIRMAFAVIGMLIAIGFAAVAYPGILLAGTAIAGAGMLGTIAQTSLSTPLQVKLRFGWVAGLLLAIQVGASIEAVILALVGAPLLPFFALQIPVVVPVIVATAIVGGRDARMRPEFDLATWRRMLGRIIPFSVAVVLSVLYFQIAQIMVSLLSTSHQTGYFGTAFRVLITFTAVPSLVVSSALPLLSRAARDDSVRFSYASRRLAEMMVVVGFGVALIVFLGAETAIQVVGGSKFGSSVDVLRILGFALLGTFVIAARGYALLALNRLRAMLICNALALGVVLAVGIPLISAHGATGAAIAMVSAELTLAVSYELALSRGRPDLRMPLSLVARVAGAAVVAGGIAVATGLGSVPATIIGSVIYGVVLLLVRAVPGELRELLPRRWRPGPAGTPT
jgi:O-antigen/teichoic acid export membrane protein